MVRASVVAALAALLVVLCGCSPIERKYRREAVRDVPFKAVREGPGACQGKVFIWGGWIVETSNRPDGTDLIVLQTPLDESDRPGERESSQGRFIARTARFLDPAIYAKGRAVTVAGVLLGAEDRALDGTTYKYPVLELRQVHLWRPEDFLGPRTSVGVGVGVGL